MFIQVPFMIDIKYTHLQLQVIGVYSLAILIKQSTRLVGFLGFLFPSSINYLSQLFTRVNLISLTAINKL